MLRYVKNGIIFDIKEIRKENSNISIPDNANLRDLGYEYLKETVSPVVDELHIAVENGAINNELQWKIEKASVPSEISMRQCRLQLLEEGLLDDVELLLSSDKSKNIEWEYTTSVKRDNAVISYISSQLNLSADVVDDMFIKANKK